MLQTVQVLVPKDLCLPIGIDEIQFYAPAWKEGTSIVEARIIEQTPNGYITTVCAWNEANGLPVACFHGYRVSIVEHHGTQPDAHALFDPASADRAALVRWTAQHPDVAVLNVALSAADDTDQEARRAASAVQVADQLGIAATSLTWSTNGAPVLAGTPDLGVSIAHGAGRLLTACGAGRIGCDLQPLGLVARRWEKILPEPRIRLWQALTGATNDRDRAGAIVWAIHEALMKAGAADLGVTFVGMQDGAPLFRLASTGVIAAGVLNFVLAGPTAIALVQLAEGVQSRRITHYVRDIEMTFKEALPPLKSPTASVFFAWMGELREEAMSDIRFALVHAFSEEGKGMVTNGTRLRIERPVPFHAPLRAWVWLERILTSHPSTFELGFQWAETGPDGAPRRIVAEGVQRLTWVDVGLEGHVTVEPFPKFFADFLAERLPPSGAAPFRPPLGHLPEPSGNEVVSWRRDPNSETEHGTARLWLETDETHSNFVGNIYFSHAAALVERTCQKALRQLGTCSGGFYATTFRLDHLGEAMPHDTLEAEVRWAAVDATVATFDLALMNQSQGGTRIATGRARYRLFPSSAEDSQPQPLPAFLIPVHTAAI
jgi:enediyne polyketide synthase